MSLPLAAKIEMPILQELVAVGGTDDLRFLYERLIPYFPTLSDAEILEIQNGSHKGWRTAVQKAGKELDTENLIVRHRGVWTITEKGRKRAAGEIEGFMLTTQESETLSHTMVQTMLLEIGRILGFYAETEFEFYDVIWRESPTSQRISHVFEVQSKGNLDSAFAKLKRAYDSQRSRPFLILSSERDSKRALKSLDREFRELGTVITILSFVELKKVSENLRSISDILPKLLEV